MAVAAFWQQFLTATLMLEDAHLAQCLQVVSTKRKVPIIHRQALISQRIKIHLYLAIFVDFGRTKSQDVSQKWQVTKMAGKMWYLISDGRRERKITGCTSPNRQATIFLPLCAADSVVGDPCNLINCLRWELCLLKCMAPYSN